MNWLIASAYADALTPAQPPTDWTSMGVSVLVGAAIVGLIWFLRHNPGAVAKAKEEGATLAAALHKLTETHSVVVAKIPAVPLAAASVPEPELSTVQGKYGQPGLFAIPVTGEANKDLAAINAQYFGSQP